MARHPRGPVPSSAAAKRISRFGFVPFRPFCVCVCVRVRATACSQRRERIVASHRCGARATQRSTLQRSTARCTAAQHVAPQHSTLHRNTARCTAAHHGTTCCNAAQHVATQHVGTRHSTLHRSASQHDLLQCSTTRCNVTHHFEQRGPRSLAGVAPKHIVVLLRALGGVTNVSFAAAQTNTHKNQPRTGSHRRRAPTQAISSGADGAGVSPGPPRSRCGQG